MSSNPPPQVRWLGQVEYEPTWQAMRDFNAVRDEQTPDELWVCEHPPVYTLGQAGKPEHLLAASDIPLVATDRGGQIRSCIAGAGVGGLAHASSWSIPNVAAAEPGMWIG